MIRELKCKNKRTYEDFKLLILNINNPTPSKKRIVNSIPYMDGSYDFSKIFGKQLYEERKPEVEFCIEGVSYENVREIYTSAVSFFNNIFNNDFSIDSVRGTFNGTVIDISDLNFIIPQAATFKVKFECNSYIKIEEYGSDIWDTFNFDLDVVERQEFLIDGTKKVTIINTNAEAEFTIESTGNIKFIFENKEYTCAAGKNKFNFLYLKNGENEFEFIGNATINFEFIKQYL